ncbi:MAG: amino acid ABC transporter substrate-binding protein, partial [Proteobacteria bacterium]|nr:amino acid ABC transporter substrate-binding protein [Pseudomonadota bacterium]
MHLNLLFNNQGRAATLAPDKQSLRSIALRKIALSLLLALSVTPSISASADEQPPLRIGALLHLTGEFAVQGVAFRQGAELAADEVNTAGGVNGRKIEVVFEDTQYKPILSNSGAKKLSQIDKVAAVLISTATEAKAAGSVLQRDSLPGIVLWDSSPEIEALGEYMFGIGPWAPSSGARSAEFAWNTLKAKRAAVIYSNTEWSQYVAKFFESRMKELGGTIVRHYSLNPEENDFRTVLAKVSESKPDVLYAPIDGNIVAFFEQVQQRKVTIPIITSDIITDEYLETSPKSFEGVYQTMTGAPDSPAAQRM